MLDANKLYTHDHIDIGLCERCMSPSSLIDTTEKDETRCFCPDCGYSVFEGYKKDYEGNYMTKDRTNNFAKANCISIEIEVRAEGTFEIQTLSQGCIYIQCINDVHYEATKEWLKETCEDKEDVLMVTFNEWTGITWTEEFIVNNIEGTTVDTH